MFCVKTLSSTWPDDKWEASMHAYLKELKKTTPSVQVDLIEFRWRRDHSGIIADIRKHFEGAQIIFQLEQGVDYFTFPAHPGIHVLHDQYEDWVSYIEGMIYAIKNNTQMYLIQTNSDIDMYRGGTVPSELYREVFRTGWNFPKLPRNYGTVSNGPTTLAVTEVAKQLTAPKPDPAADEWKAHLLSKLQKCKLSDNLYVNFAHLSQRPEGYS